MRPTPEAALACLLLASCAGSAAPHLTAAVEPSAQRGRTPLDVERELAARVDEERAAERIRALCALGPRMGGTRSGARAADYLREQFEAMGLEVQVREDPALRCHEETAWRVAAQGEGGETLELASAWPYGFSPSASGRAQLALEPAEGAALLSQGPLRLRRGPRPAVVLVDGETTDDGRYPVVLHLRGRDGDAVPHFGLSRADGELLRERLARGAATGIEFELEAAIREAAPRTVVARLPGRDSGAGWGSEHLLVCAHGDSDAGGPGADDNASGVAAVLEVAQAWSAAVASGALEPPAKEVRFAIWGSEIHSSRAYLERRGAQDGELAGVLNFDQAGFGSGADRVFVEPDDVPANQGMARTLCAVLRDHAARAGDPPGSFPSEWASVKSLGGTDSYVFSDSAQFSERGLPSMTVYASAWGTPAEHPRTPGMPGESWSQRDAVAVDYDVHYHSAGDTPENTTEREPWNTAWCARVALLGARRYLAGTEQAP
jgi:hypothetical protein